MCLFCGLFGASTETFVYHYLQKVTALKPGR